MPARLGPASHAARGRWRLGLAVTLGVSVPCLVVEEDWHGRPMIDLHSLLWLPFAVAAAGAFLAGGAIAASGAALPARRLLRVLWRGCSCAAAAAGILLACDAVRRFGVAHDGLSTGVVELWIDACLGSVALGGLGAFLARAGRRRRRRSVGLVGSDPVRSPLPR